MGLVEGRVEAVVAVSSLERARHFYEDQLGLQPSEVEQEGVRYCCAGSTALFIYVAPDNAGKSPATMAGWFVDDLAQTLDELTDRGLAPEHVDQPGIHVDERGIMDAGRFLAVWFRDPDGNTIAISQLTPENSH